MSALVLRMGMEFERFFFACLFLVVVDCTNLIESFLSTFFFFSYLFFCAT